jgi:hypothetical protein
MPYHFFRHRYRPGFRYGQGFHRRHRPYRWSWLHRQYPPEGPVSSPFVAWAQRVLAQVFGPIVPQDGVFGSETRGFVGQFQVQRGLPTSGDLDDATVAALQAAVAGPELGTPIPWRLEPGMPRGWRPEPGMPHGRHGDPGAPHRGRREPPMPQAGGREPPTPQPGRSAPQPPPPPISPAAAPSPSEAPAHPHHVHPPGPPGSGEEAELAPSSPQASKRGRWVREGGRIVLIGA